MSSTQTISKQAGRRYPQMRSTGSLGARPLQSLGTSAAGGFVAKFRRTISLVGSSVGKRQTQDG